jgi:hypothetical protein
MRLPTGKGKPKLPPTPKGGGAAARQEQSELERGLEPVENGPVDEKGQAKKTRTRNKKKKK